jgi:hypothetical protein
VLSTAQIPEVFAAFMKTVAAKYVDRDVHVTVDNLGAHFTAEVDEWLVDNPDIAFHRTSVGASWIKQIEIWFGLITRRAISPRNIQLNQTDRHHHRELHRQLEAQLQNLLMGRRWRDNRRQGPLDPVKNPQSVDHRCLRLFPHAGSTWCFD